MAVSASEVFKFNAEKQYIISSMQGLEDEGPLRLLRQIMVGHLTGTGMAIKQENEIVQARARGELSLDSTRNGHQELPLDRL